MNINGIGPRELGAPESEHRAGGGERFADALTRWLHEVNSDQVEAASKIKDLVVEGKGTIHDAMIAINNAEGSFRLLMEMRNRLIDGVNRLLQAGR